MEIKKNIVVSMEYTGKLNDGTVFDSSEGRGPLEFIYGQGKIIPGLENNLEGLKKGDEKNIKLSADEAYGQYREDAVQEISNEEFPQDVELKEGLNLMAQTPYGPIPVRVKEVKDNSAIIDFNHPLAGKDLEFDVKIVDLREATEEELEKGLEHERQQEEGSQEESSDQESSESESDSQ